MGHGHPPGSWNGPGSPVAVDDGTSARTEAPAPGAVGLNGGSRPPAAGGSMAERIVAFARGRLAAKVGDGQCFTLTDRAVRGAGAKSAADFGEITPDANYTWGQTVSLSDLQPGDIIQFRDYDFTRTVVTDNASGTSTSETGGDRPHHTAIVERVGANGSLTVLEQNVPRRSPVLRSQLFFTNSTTRSGGTTTTIRVQGTFWFYRPQAR